MRAAVVGLALLAGAIGAQAGSLASVDLPAANHVQPLPSDVPQLVVTTSAVMLEGLVVTSSATWSREALDAGFSKVPRHGDVVLAAASNVPWRDVSRVLSRAQASGYSQIRLAARDRSGTPVLLKVRAAFHPSDSLDPAVVDKVIKTDLATIQACYERRVRSKPGLRGKVLVHFVIEPDGHVSSVGVKASSMDDPETEDCAAREVLTLHFPVPKNLGVVTVNYPLLFDSKTLKRPGEMKLVDRAVASSPPVAPVPDANGQIDVRVYLSSTAFTISEGANPGTSVADAPALTKALSSVRKAYPSQTKVLLLPNDGAIPWSGVVRAIDLCAGGHLDQVVLAGEAP